MNDPQFTIKATDVKEERKRVCCNCGHSLRVRDPQNPILVDHNECEIDGHYIGYIACFEHWCPRWRKEKPQERSCHG